MARRLVTRRGGARGVPWVASFALPLQGRTTRGGAVNNRVRLATSRRDSEYRPTVAATRAQTVGVTAGELASILIGAGLAVLGCAAALASLLRPRRGIQLLLAFGARTGLYGIRLLASQAPVRTTLGETWIPWDYLIACLTYVINIPFTYFVEGVIGPGWKNSTRWVRRVVIAFAMAAILIDLAWARPEAATVANSWLVLILVSIALAHGLYASRIAHVQTILTDRIAVLGAAVFAAFIINRDGRCRRHLRFRSSRTITSRHPCRRRVGTWDSGRARRVDGEGRVFGAGATRRRSGQSPRLHESDPLSPP